MKIVVLESSPNRKGASNTLADAFIRGAKEAGHKVSLMDVAHMKFSPCTGCYRGHDLRKCVLKDEFKQVETALENADMIVYVTPVYYYLMTAPLKAAVDRLHCFSPKLHGKKSLLIATAWRSDDEVMQYLKAWYEGLAEYLEYGKAKHIGISFHSGPELLERVLKEHPEIEFVQLAINYIDWASEFVRAKDCYEIARKYGKQIIVMEPVKGGGLANLPEKAEKVLKEAAPDKSVVSWAFRFLCSRLEGVITTLSGMSTPEQEWEALNKAIRIYRDSAPVSTDTIEKYRGLTYHGIPATAILEAYSICQIQPAPGFSDDNNYPKNAMAERHMDVDNDADFPEEKVALPDGTDGTPLLKKAEDWLRKHHF